MRNPSNRFNISCIAALVVYATSGECRGRRRFTYDFRELFPPDAFGDETIEAVEEPAQGASSQASQGRKSKPLKIKVLNNGL